MKKYFINNGTTQLGPFDIEELKQKKINKETIVWHEGLVAWTAARNIEELKPMFYVTPPTYSTQTNAIQETERNISPSNEFNYLQSVPYFGISKRTFISVSLLLVIALIVFFILF